MELLRSGERSVSELQAGLEIEASSVSQQLAVLRAKSIVDTRPAGTSVLYSVRDPQVFQLLDVARDNFDNHLIDLRAVLKNQEASDAVTETPRGNGVRLGEEVTATWPPNARLGRDLAEHGPS